jgi:hypothetical protein
LVARFCVRGILALVAILFLVPSFNMPSAMNGPVTAENEADSEYDRENVEEVPAPPKKKTRGPGKKNGA